VSVVDRRLNSGHVIDAKSAYEIFEPSPDKNTAIKTTTKNNGCVCFSDKLKPRSSVPVFVGERMSPTTPHVDKRIPYKIMSPMNPDPNATNARENKEESLRELFSFGVGR